QPGSSLGMGWLSPPSVLSWTSWSMSIAENQPNFLNLRYKCLAHQHAHHVGACGEVPARRRMLVKGETHRTRLGMPGGCSARWRRQQSFPLRRVACVEEG